MPRNFVFSDGRNLVQIDPYGTLRDLCVPIGTNHLCGRPIRFGVGVDHQFSWCDDTRFWSHTQSTKDFDFTLGYEIWESVSFGLPDTYLTESETESPLANALLGVKRFEL